MPRTLPAGALAILLLLAPPGAASPSAPLPQDDAPEKALKDADVQVRLAAVRKIANGDRSDAEALLLSALGDRDGEVVEKACEALARKGGEKSVRPLSELALGASMRRIRLAAAAALGATSPEAGAKLIQTALSAKDDFTAACAAEALAEIRHPSSKDYLRAALSEKSPYLRREAARALGALRDKSTIKDLETVLSALDVRPDRDIRAQAGAIEGIARIGDPRSLSILLSALQEKDLSDVLERRIASAIRRILFAARGTEEGDSGGRKVLDAYRNEKSGAASARLARVVGSLCRALPPEPPAEPAAPAADGTASVAPERPPRPPLEGPSALEGEGPIAESDAAVKALGEVGLAQTDPAARRAAVAALGRIGGTEAMEHLKRAASADADDLVRFHALRGWRRWYTARNEAAFQIYGDRLRYDKSALVREEAAVGLGVKGLEGSFDTLTAAFGDKSWEVAVSAAVSLGKTRDPKALQGLLPLLESKDWKLRGAAAAGIGWSRDEKAVPTLIGLLGDPEVSVARTAWEFLKRLTDRDLPFKQKDWESFWSEKGTGFVLVDREAELRDAKKYGYALNDRDVYENLDVLVLKSRGDSIEELLMDLGIERRLTQSAAVKKSGVQPFGVFVSNCTGEMQPDDHERVAWFVHAGGALFASCWAIDTTIGKEFPGTMCRWRGFKGQVLSQAQAEELPTESEYLKGVFPLLARPIYELYGAYLIEVLDPERLEVLVDSPETAAKFSGCGNLAAWFTSGHGVVMGASNHFHRQTMTQLKGAWGVSVKSEAERRAFAVNHFGFTWEKVRELDSRGVFSRQSEAEKEVVDLSAFRFLTNFVRRKRIEDL